MAPTENNWQRTKEVLEVAGLIGGGLAGCWGLVSFFRSRISIALNTFIMPARWLHSFGPDAPAIVLERLESLEASRIDCQHSRLEYLFRLNSLERHTEIGVYVCDAAGKCIGINEHITSQFGMDRSELLDYGWSAAIAIEDRSRVVDLWKACVAGGIPYDATYDITNKATGKRYTVSSQAEAFVVNDTTFLIGIVTTVEL